MSGMARLWSRPAGGFEDRMVAVEERIHRRRAAIRSRSADLVHGFRQQLTSPGGLVLAALVGVVLGSDRFLQGWKLKALVQVIGSGVRLGVAPASGATEAAGADPH